MTKRDDQFAVRYEIEDGYAGASRSHTFYINAGDLPDNASDAESLLYEMTEENMLQKISPAVNNRDEFIEWAADQIAKMAQEE